MATHNRRFGRINEITRLRFHEREINNTARRFVVDTRDDLNIHRSSVSPGLRPRVFASPALKPLIASDGIFDAAECSARGRGPINLIAAISPATTLCVFAAILIVSSLRCSNASSAPTKLSLFNSLREARTLRASTQTSSRTRVNEEIIERRKEARKRKERKRWKKADRTTRVFLQANLSRDS